MIAVYRALQADRRGTTSAEFIVLLVCIAVAGVASWRFMGSVILSIISGD